MVNYTCSYNCSRTDRDCNECRMVAFPVAWVNMPVAKTSFISADKSLIEYARKRAQEELATLETVLQDNGKS